ncbi:MAG: hypothetical protein ACLT3W_02905 [Bifidobacterium pseudocatenulatum]
MVVRPEASITFDPRQNVIAGNVTGFGLHFPARCVPWQVVQANASACATAASVGGRHGDHGYESLTGGTVVILGPTECQPLTQASPVATCTCSTAT